MDPASAGTATRNNSSQKRDISATEPLNLLCRCRDEWPADRGFAMTSSKSAFGRIGAAAISLAVSLAALGGAAVADPLGLAEPMRNPGMIFDNVLRDRGSDLGLAAHLRRQVVTFSGSEAPGTIVIDTANTYLYYVLGGGRAMRY